MYKQNGWTIYEYCQNATGIQGVLDEVKRQTGRKTTVVIRLNVLSKLPEHEGVYVNRVAIRRKA